MKIAWVNKQFIQKRNRIVSRIAKLYQRGMLRIKVLAVRWLASFLNCIDGKSVAPVSETLLSSNGKQEITVNCMGAVDMAGGPGYDRDLASVAQVIAGAGVSFALAVNGTADTCRETKNLLERSGVTLLCPERRISSRLIGTAFGKIAVITYDYSRQPQSDLQDKIEIMRHIQAAKKRKAEYTILYFHVPAGKHVDKQGGSRIFKTLGLMGADYIVGVTPGRRDSGSTYRKYDGNISRSIFSLGSFLTEDGELSKKRVILRLKLGTVQGKLQLIEETYLPFYHVADKGLISLLEKSQDVLAPEQITKYRAEIEDEMPRIRPVDRILTVSRVMELIGAELPPELTYLKDFSVGKVCARSFEVKPGDIFFFREPFADPNDLEPVSEERRVRIAKNAAKRGALLLVTYERLPFTCRSVICNDVREGHIAVCAHLRGQFDMRTVGITGSVGKTSTKDMLAEVMRMCYRTVKSERNANVQVKIGENLQALNSACEVFIQEIGGGRPGGASRHARMVLPEVTVVTNIGDAHIGNFGSKEKLMENKLQIIEGMDENGTLYLNGDDPLLAKADPGCKVVRYAVHNRDADYYVEDLQQFGAYCTFDIVHEDTRTPVKLHVLGEYNVLNAVCCFAIGKKFGMPEEEIVMGLSHFQTTGIRQNLIEVCGRKLFMDCYNASSDSVKSALEILKQIQIEPGKKRIAVVGDITGTGDLAQDIHREIGHTISQYAVDYVLLFGEDVKYTYEVLRELRGNVYHFTKREELNQMLQDTVDIGDVAMFKGSSKMLLEYSVDQVYGTRLTDQRLQDEREYKYARHGSVVYDLYANHATAEVYDPLRSGERRVQIANRVGSIEVVNMGRALRGRNIAEVIMPDTIRHISAEAFMDCTQLTVVRMPKKLKYIGNGAFKNCRNLQEIKLPEHVMHVGKEAFSGCHGLCRITIPASVVQIGKDAFDGCENCQFICPRGSYAESYLLAAGLNPQVQ